MSTTPENFWEQVAQIALERGAMVLERVHCRACGQISLAAHTWSETTQCQHCNTKHASRVPRLPIKGEITLEHLTGAIQTLKECYARGPLGKWSTQDEWNNLPDNVKLLVTQNITAAVLAALVQVESLAKGFAQAGNMMGE